MTKRENRITLYSPLFGYVEVVKRGIAIREKVFKGFLVHDWFPTVVDEMGLTMYYYRKGQMMWFSRDHFIILIDELPAPE